MLHHFPRNFPCNQRGSLVLVNPLSPVTRRFFLYSGQSLVQDPDQSHQPRLMEHHSHRSGPLKALIQGRGSRPQKQPLMSQLGTTVCLVIVWLLRSQSGALSLCSLLHLSHLQVDAHSSFLLSCATHRQSGWHPQFTSGQLLHTLLPRVLRSVQDL